MDAATVFGMLFGADIFEDYVGTLVMAKMMSMDPDNSPQETASLMQEGQKVQLLSCARKLGAVRIRLSMVHL